VGSAARWPHIAIGMMCLVQSGRLKCARGASFSQAQEFGLRYVDQVLVVAGLEIHLGLRVERLVRELQQRTGTVHVGSPA
jgi:hypothetical protein